MTKSGGNCAWLSAWAGSTGRNSTPAIPKDDPQNAKVALEGAREGIVLLKNEGNLLPLDPAKVKKIVGAGPKRRSRRHRRGGERIREAVSFGEHAGGA